MKNQFTFLIRLTIVAICLIAAPMMTQAQTYASLWKKVDESNRKDLPKTAIAQLQQIVNKAKAERNYGQFLKAQMMMLQKHGDISQDSLKANLERVVAYEQNIRKSNPVLAHVYQSILARFFAETPELDNAKLHAEYAKLAMSEPEKLAQVKVKDYEPMAVEGVDANIFNHDLLHLVGYEVRDFKTLYDFYLARGNRSAACLCAHELLTKQKHNGVLTVKKSRYLQQIDSLINVYKDLAVCGELAIDRYHFMEQASDTDEKGKIDYINYALAQWGVWPRMNILRNAQKRLTQPNYLAVLNNKVLTPNKKHTLRINTLTNIQQLTLTITRLNLQNYENLNPSNSRDLARIKRLMLMDTQKTETRRYVGLPDYMVTSDSIDIAPLERGVYLAEITANNDVPVERAVFFVSNVMAIRHNLPNNKVRFVAVNATTGEPIAGANIKLTFTNKKAKDVVLTCDSNGEVVYEKTDDYFKNIEVYTADDHFCPSVYGYDRSARYYNDFKERYTIDTFIDRAIYRPGQTVHVAAIVQHRKDDVTSNAAKDVPLTITLRDVNSQELAKKEVVTDEFGTVATDFVLPATGLTGNYRITIKGNDATDYCYFNVEEYKRPTFDVEFDKVKEKYQSGDTIHITGHAKNYSGVAVQDARVAYTVTRRPTMWWYGRGSIENIATDTVTTDADGRFQFPLVMELPESLNNNEARYYSYDINVDVTDRAGESHNAETSLPLSNRTAILYSNLPKKVIADSLNTVTYSYENIMREPIEGTVKLTFKAKNYNKSFTCEANKPFDLKKLGLRSAEYIVEAVCATDTISEKMVVFSLKDKQPVVETHDWYFISATQFPENGKPVYLQFGSSDENQYVYYSITTNDKVVEKGIVKQSNAITTRSFVYKEEWGDGIAINLACVRDGKLYAHSETIYRPLPNKKLNLKWTTFRDRLTPGQKETWTLNITDSKGKPVKAQLLSALYDKSLDAIEMHDWTQTLFTPHVNVYNAEWLATMFGNVQIYGERAMRFLTERPIGYCHWDEDVFPKERVYIIGYSKKRSLLSRVFKPAASKSSTAIGSFDIKGNDDSNGEILKAKEAIQASAVNNIEMTEAIKHKNNNKPSASVRENLQETAFFYPALVADGKGNVNIQFTLPESVTTWRFMGLAHDKNMNSGYIDAEAVASKKVMIQPNMLRFVRRGDKPTLSANVSNSSNKLVKGKARIEIVDPETEKVILAISKDIELNANESKPVQFSFMPKQYPDVVIVRMMVEGNDYSDGEQHYLPVLPDKELVTTTKAFSLQDKGQYTVDLTKLFPEASKQNRLTYEYTARPEWMLIETLPTVSNPTNDNALSLTTALYANTLSGYILKLDPSIKKFVENNEIKKVNDGKSALQSNAELKTMLLDETPWMADAKNETEQRELLKNFFDENATQYRTNNIVEKLSELANDDGSFPWYPGMKGSRFVTTAVYKMLVRLQKMTGSQPMPMELVNGCRTYLISELNKEAAEMKKLEKKGMKNVLPSETALDIIYSLSLAGESNKATVKSTIDYMVGKLAKVPTVYTIYGKASTAVILALNGHKAKANEYLQSINEYSVYTPEMGRYYDSPKAYYSWFDYKIPTQVAVIEAYKLLQADSAQFINDLQQWLLQSKRTQSWDTPLNTANAVYAFFGGNNARTLTTNNNDFTIKLNGNKVDVANNPIGYVKGVETGKDLKSLSFEKTTSGTSWGAVYAQSIQTTANVAAAGTNLKVKREIIAKGDVKVGDRIKVRLTITADRDYDFVQLQDKRAACLEPVSQLSGYRWGYYIAPKDNATNYYFDTLAKGEHVIETEYYVDREGEYTSGICTVQCAYAPEYSGRDAAFKIVVK
jgi:hypothetical protein